MLVPLRVAVDATSLLEAKTGVGVFVDELLARLGSRPALDVGAFAITWRGRGRLPDELPPGVAARTRVLPAQPLRWCWRRFDRPRLDGATGRPDVVHGPNYVVPPMRRAASVVTVHDLTPVRFPELCNADTLQYPELIRRALRRGAWVHTDSDFVRDEVVEHFAAPPERVVTVPLGVRAVGPGDGRAGRALAGGDRYVLALGTVEPRKDLPSLVRAFDAIAATDHELRLVIAGKDGWGANALAAAIDRAANADRIVRLGYVSDDDRVALTRGALVYAYPSIYEGFGLPPLEAMSANVPVVATDAGALAETLGDGAAVVPVGDADALASALQRVTTDDAYRRDLIGRGRAVAAGWSWDRCADGLTRLYHLAAGREQATP